MVPSKSNQFIISHLDIRRQSKYLWVFQTKDCADAHHSESIPALVSLGQTQVSETPSRPKRLRLIDATMIIMGSMIGSGIFLAPALIAGIVVESRLGAGSFVLVWIVGGLLTLCAALSFGELASAFPKTGGQYVYLKEAFTPFWGFCMAGRSSPSFKPDSSPRWPSRSPITSAFSCPG